MVNEIRISDQKVRFARATRNADFRARRVITSSPWEYVALWLRLNRKITAQTYWEQAKYFFDSARELPTQSAPLPLYYSFLNATKSLLDSKGVNYLPYHGITGFDVRTPSNARISLESEGLKIKNGGVLPALINYFGETETNTIYKLAEILSNLAFVHRAYTTSYNRRAELFLSVNEPRYVKAGNGQARFQAFLPAEHTHGQTLNTLPTGFQTRDPDEGESRKFGNDCKVLESVDTFAWSGARRPTSLDIDKLTAFHSNLRIDLNYISGIPPLLVYQEKSCKLHTY